MAKKGVNFRCGGGFADDSPLSRCAAGVRRVGRVQTCSGKKKALEHCIQEPLKYIPRKGVEPL